MRGKQWIENVAWVLITTAAVLGILFGYALLSGCASTGEGLGKGAMTAALDRLESKLTSMQGGTSAEPSISEGGMAAIIAAMNGLFAIFYLARKKWFPMKSR